MAFIPVIPGVSITTGGALNRPMSDLICALLFGGLNNMLAGNMICINANLSQILNSAGLPGVPDLQRELEFLRQQTLGFENALGIPNIMGQINGAIGMAQNMLTLGGMCGMGGMPGIPNILAEMTNAYFGQAQALLSQLGALTSPQLCLNGLGQLNTGAWQPGMILADMNSTLQYAGSIPARTQAYWANSVSNVSYQLQALINRPLFPDFAHRWDLTRGGYYIPGNTGAITYLPRPADSDIIKMVGVPPTLYTENGPIPNPAYQVAVDDLLSKYPPANNPNLRDASNTAKLIASAVCQTASYPVTDAYGVRHENIWPTILGPQGYALALAACNNAPIFSSRPIQNYDYCGRPLAPTEQVLQGDPLLRGGDGIIGAARDPLNLVCNIIWIDGRSEDPDRIGWAVVGQEAEQLIGPTGNKRKVLALELNPTINLTRGDNYIISLPPSNPTIPQGFKAAEHGGTPLIYPLPTGQELYIYETKIVNGQTVPDITKPFNKGLFRYETNEYLAEANGRNEDHITWESVGGIGPEATEDWTYTQEVALNPDWDKDALTAVKFPVLDYNRKPIKIPTWKRSISTLITGSTLSIQVEPKPNIVTIENQYDTIPNSARWPNKLAYSNENGTIFGIINIVPVI